MVLSPALAVERGLFLLPFEPFWSIGRGERTDLCFSFFPKNPAFLVFFVMRGDENRENNFASFFSKTLSAFSFFGSAEGGDKDEYVLLAAP